MIDYQKARNDLVESLARRGIRDPLVLKAMNSVERHRFVAPNLRSRAYEDVPLPIGEHQTISQPYMVAYMTELLRLTGREKVLEIGTGSGYQAVILAQLASRVFTIERIVSLAKKAKLRFDEMCTSNIIQKIGDGTLGWQEFAPFDRIVVTAGAPAIPDSLMQQLADGGSMVIPSGSRRLQDLKLVEKRGDKIITLSKGGCVFVPLLGNEGWK